MQSPVGAIKDLVNPYRFIAALEHQVEIPGVILSHDFHPNRYPAGNSSNHGEYHRVSFKRYDDNHVVELTFSTTLNDRFVDETSAYGAPSCRFTSSGSHGGEVLVRSVLSKFGGKFRYENNDNGRYTDWENVDRTEGADWQKSINGRRVVEINIIDAFGEVGSCLLEDLKGDMLNPFERLADTLRADNGVRSWPFV